MGDSILSRLDTPFQHANAELQEDEASVTSTTFKTGLDDNDETRCTIPDWDIDLKQTIDHCHILPRTKEAVVCFLFILH